MIVAGIIAKFGVSGLLMVTAMAGVILILMGATGLGVAVRFIPRPVTIGFTNGIAVLIASTQIADFFGLQAGNVPSDFLGRMKVLASHAGTVSWAATGLACGSLTVHSAVAASHEARSRLNHRVTRSHNRDCSLAPSDSDDWF